MKVLIVDDSVVFRTQIATALSRTPGIEVVGTAAHGRIAIQKLEQLSCDLMTLDLEMPEMNGLEVLREVRRRGFPIRVIVFSSQTQRGAEAALEALREGAEDVVAKPIQVSGSIDDAAEAIRAALIPKVLQFFRPEKPKDFFAGVSGSNFQRDLEKFSAQVLLIGCSTGGPPALEAIFSHFSPPVEVPILIVQHMPPVFTEILARRLGEISGLPSMEVKKATPIEKNKIYVAPGDYHLIVEGSSQAPLLTLNQNPQRNSVRPAVDYLFETASHVYESGCLGVVLTGMGEDGLVGSTELRRQGGAVVIQDRASCVVFGMPGALYEAGEYDKMLPLQEMGVFLSRKAKGVRI